jgi:murein endopeptidase
MIVRCRDASPNRKHHNAPRTRTGCKTSTSVWWYGSKKRIATANKRKTPREAPLTAPERMAEPSSEIPTPASPKGKNLLLPLACRDSRKRLIFES